MIVTCLYWICFAYILIWTLSPKRSWEGRLLGLGILAASFALDYFTGWGWLLVLVWGGVCWSASRAGET